MSMFCFQCQEAARNIECEKRKMCGKDEDVAKLQDLLIYSLQGLSYAVITTKTDVSTIEGINRELIDSYLVQLQMQTSTGMQLHIKQKK